MLFIFGSLLFAFFLYFFFLPFLRYKIFINRTAKEVNAYSQPYVPFIGNYLLAQRSSREDYMAYIKSMKTIFTKHQVILTNFLDKNLVILYRPQYLKEFYNKAHSFRFLPKISYLFQMMFGSQNLGNLQGKAHLQKRKQMSQILNFQFINKKASSILQIVKNSFDRLEGVVNVSQKSTQTTINVMTSCFLDSQVLNQKIEGKSITTYIQQMFQHGLQTIKNPMYLFFGVIPNKFKEYCTNCTQLARLIIKQKFASGQNQNRESLIDLIYKCSKSSQQNLKLTNLSKQFISLYFAGSDTTTHSIVNCLYYLAKYPLVANQIYEQVKSFDCSQISSESGKHFKKLNFLIKQSHRMNGPSYGTMFKQAVEDLYINDLFIPKGTVVGNRFDFNSFNDQFFQNPYQFSLQHWNRQLDPFVFLPFSSGPKVCLGQYLALLQIRLVIIYVAQNYKLNLDPSQQVKIVQRGMLGFNEPLRVSFEKR